MSYRSTFYWYDYETFGKRPAYDWPAQFAGVRTDEHFNIIEEPLNIYCRFPSDKLPDPEACLITGITPDIVNKNGLCEADFMRCIHKEFSRPQTCIVGYNNFSFDDEVTRYNFYRNLIDPYAHEWKNGNSRWDLLEVVRLCAALRPEIMRWPTYDDGSLCLKLDRLSYENGIAHEHAHNALSDVEATIGLARLIHEKNPKMLSYLLRHKDKRSVINLINRAQDEDIIHIASFFSAKRYYSGVVMPLAYQASSNSYIVYDLCMHPEAWLSMSVEQIQASLFSRDRTVAPIALRKIRANRCPILVPASVLRSEDKERLGIDLEQLKIHRALLKNVDGLHEKILQVFDNKDYNEENDPDFMLYHNAFFSTQDRMLLDEIRATDPDGLSTVRDAFEDQRLAEMFFRYRARNWSHTLNAEERQRWDQHCLNAMLSIRSGDTKSHLSLFKERIEHLIQNSKEHRAEDQKILKHLMIYAQNLEETFLEKSKF